MLDLLANTPHSKARDHSRTPMQWDASPNAGFCPADATPWMRVIDDYKTGTNAAAQMAFESDAELSPWQWWQRALADRKAHKDVFVYGDFEDVSAAHERVYAYVRTSSTDAADRWVVVLNFSGAAESWALPEGVEVADWVATTYGKGKAEGRAVRGAVALKPWEGLLGRLKAA